VAQIELVQPDCNVRNFFTYTEVLDRVLKYLETKKNAIVEYRYLANGTKGKWKYAKDRGNGDMQAAK